MKKITFFIFLLSLTFSFAQQQEYLLEFEEGTPSGDVSNWLTFEGDIPPAQIIDNPDTDGGTVPVTKVLKVIAPAGGNFFDGVNNSFAGEAFGTWKLDASVANNGTFSMDVNKDFVGTVGIKMATNTGGTSFQITDQNVDNTVVNEWQTLTWSIDVAGISPTEETNISQIVVFINWIEDQSPQPADATLHIDNIKFNAEKLTEPSEGGGDTGANAPAVAAPNPTESEADVISLFSNAYTDVAVNTWRTSWSQAQLEDLQIEGNDTKRYFDLDFVGVETTGDNLVDASDMEFFHIDIWTANATQYKIKLVDFGADGAFDGGDDTEHELVYDAPTQEEWVSLKIPLSDFTNLENKNNLAQYIFSAQPTGSAELFVDNVYFSKQTLSSINFNASKISIYPNPATTNFTIESEVTLDNVRVFNMLGKMMLDITNPSKSIDASSLNSGVYLVQLTSGEQNLTKRLIIK